MKDENVKTDEKDEKKVSRNQIIPESFFSENGWEFSLNYGGSKVFKKNKTNVMWDPELNRVVLVYNDDEANQNLKDRYQTRV